MGKKRILLVEDEPDLFEVVKAALEFQGYEIIPAHDGLAAFNKAKEHIPDIIILDIMLPKMDGYKVCGMLKADTRLSRIPIIMLTALGEDIDKKLGEEMKVDSYLVKPFEPHKLLEEVKRLIL